MEIISLMGIIWLVAAVVFAIVEALTMGLTSIWFAGGALLAGVTAFFTPNIGIQIAVFLVVSVILVAVTRPIARKHINDKAEKTNIDAVIGSKGIALTDIGPLKPGQVKAEGKEWSATSGFDIKSGEEVEILDIKGVTLIVK